MGQHPRRDPRVEAALDELKPALRGITIDETIFRPATFIEDSISNLSRAIWFGAILMILMLCLSSTSGARR